MAQSYTGSCLCDDLRFGFDGPSLWCAHCHCSMCQRTHGAPLVTWVGVAEERFRILAGDTLHWHRSSPEAERGFCNHCGSSLFFRSTRWPGEIHVVRTNIEGELDREPEVHAYWESHARWFSFDDDLARPVKDS